LNGHERFHSLNGSLMGSRNKSKNKKYLSLSKNNGTITQNVTKMILKGKNDRNDWVQSNRKSEGMHFANT
jgi:hypothetical protein